MIISMSSVRAIRQIFATIAVLALVFSPFANVQFADAAPGAKTFTASVNPATLGFNETKSFTFSITNTSGADGEPMKSFRIVLPFGFSVSNYVLSKSGWNIGLNGSQIEASDQANPDWIVPGETVTVTADITHTALVGGVSDWVVCAYKNNSFNPGGGAQFDADGAADASGCGVLTTITVDDPVIPCDAPYTGNQPDCVPPPCEDGWTGTYPNCVPPVVPCPDPYTGNQPDCVPPPCPEGTEGTYPDCVDTVIPCEAPYTGNMPDCVPPPCPEGYTGTYPNCEVPVIPCDAPYTGNQPDCVPPPCDEGWTGEYPNCVPPVTPCPDGYTGTYPNCFPPVETCQDDSANNYGQEGACTYDEPEICSITVVSDETNTVVEKGGAFAQSLSFIHDAWTASIAGATWIWGDDPVVDPSVDETQTFEKTFVWNGPASAANLAIASDNSYVVSLNGTEVGSTLDLNNFQLATQDSISIATGLFITGTNTLSIEVLNKGVDEEQNPQANPAGLLYSLIVEGDSETDCTTVPQTERFTLDITITGDGEGNVQTDGEVADIMCFSDETEIDCSETYEDGTVVTLVATPNPGSNFDSSWTVGAGTCTGNTTPCAVTMNQNHSLVAHFALNGGSDDGGNGGNGRRIELSDGGGRVAGDSDSNEPTPQVLGEATSVFPVGAPNTGAGGAAPVSSYGLHLVSAILAVRRSAVHGN